MIKILKKMIKVLKKIDIVHKTFPYSEDRNKRNGYIEESRFNNKKRLKKIKKKQYSAD